ncbi:MAG: LLM class flavin-dependent oxidoreductase [Pseudomonadota bacterium]|nr:LLM class flavin-dependent oxidoreductase [Pseudomonadota bacterium]
MIAPSPLFNTNRLKLGVFGFNGQAPSNTLLDELYVPTWPRILEVGSTADAAGFEALVPFARWKYGRSHNSPNAATLDVYDPFIWAAGLAQATRHSAVLATAHMSLIHPVIAAKQAATIDHVSGGRFALNVVAGWNEPEFLMFGAPLLEHAQRYAQAAEWMEVVTRLWGSSDAFDFQGSFYTIKKGESFPKPVQRPAPPIMSAGGSDQGRRFAVRYADLCFTLLRSDDPDVANADVAAYREPARRDHARDVQVWTVAYVIQRDSQEEANAYQKRVIDHADRDANEAMMSMLGAQSKMMSAEAFLAFKNRYIAGAGGFPLVGTAEAIADRCVRLSGAGVDGLLLCWIDFADGLARWIREVMPLLERAGLRDPFPAAR